MKILSEIKLALLAILMLFFRGHQPDCNRGITNNTTISTDNLVIISVDNFKNNRLNFYYHDSLAYGHPVTISAKETKLLLNSSTLLFQADNKQTPFLIHPGEKINIRYAGTDSIQLYIKNNVERTNELNFFRKLVKNTGNIYPAPFMTIFYQKKVNTLKDMEASEKMINNIKNVRLRFLRDFASEFSISTAFDKIAANAINSSSLTDTLLLYAHNFGLLNKRGIYKKLILKKIPSLNSIGFEPLQTYFFTCTTLVSIFITNSLSDMILNSADFNARYDFIMQNFSSSTRNFLISNTIYEASLNNIPVSNKQLNEYKTLCRDSGYKA